MNVTRLESLELLQTRPVGQALYIPTLSEGLEAWLKPLEIDVGVQAAFDLCLL